MIQFYQTLAVSETLDDFKLFFNQSKCLSNARDL